MATLQFLYILRNHSLKAYNYFTNSVLLNDIFPCLLELRGFAFSDLQLFYGKHLFSISDHFFTDLGVCRVVSFTYSHSSLLQVFFFPLLRYVIPEVLPPSLMGSALANSGSLMEPAGISFIRHRGSFQQLLAESTPVNSPLPKPCHATLIDISMLF